MNGMKYFEEMASELYNPAVRAWKQAGKHVVTEILVEEGGIYQEPQFANRFFL